MTKILITHCIQCGDVGTTWFPVEHTEAEVDEIRKEELAKGYTLSETTIEAHRKLRPDYCYCNID